MTYEPLNPDAPGFDDRNARYLARACALAYLPGPEGAAGFRDDLGLDARLIAVDNTQAYLGTSDAAIVVAFRGSQGPTGLDGLKDWLLTNASNFLILPEGRIGTDFVAAGVGARFHRGFMQALAEVWDPLAEAVNAAIQQAERPVWVTGHSLGGALALMAAWRCTRQFVPVHQVYTFGAPMIGNDLAAQAFKRELPGKIFRYVDDPDPVPLLPTVSLVANTYNHCLEEVRMEAGTAESAAKRLAALAGGAVQGLINATLIDEVWNYVRSRVDAHMIGNYLEQIERRCSGGGA